MDSPANSAVFISYASQDAAGALRLCAALRAAGIEVWFDQAELAGGDGWDRKIRGQIAVCALFVPVISAATQERLEGYFRLEWKLAAQRTHTMADAKPFLLPVVIDATRDADAHVPEEFRAVQWTRLPGGEASAVFCARVTTLLIGSEVGRVSDPSLPSVNPPRAGQGPAQLPSRRFPKLVAATAVLALAATAAFFALRNFPSPAATPAASSVAVLAFANMSAEKDTEYFSDGISEELLNVLAKLPGLKVSARTSAFFYKGKQVAIKQVAQELGVAYIVEGSVRKSGDRVRITAQLIKADDSFHVWSDNFDRELKDIFAVQDEIAGLIAKNLSLKLGLAPAAAPGAAPTQNLAAYDLYLRGRAEQTSVTRRNSSFEAVRLYEEALRLDPGYALASARLSQVFFHSFRVTGYDRSEQNAMRARNAALTAVRLDPNLPEAHLALALVRQAIDYDLGAAQRELDEAERLRPNDPEAPAVRLELELARGRWGDAMQALATRAAELDPRNAASLLRVAEILRIIGRFAESERRYEQGWAMSGWTLTYNSFPLRGRSLNTLAWTGDLPGALVRFETVPTRDLNNPTFYRERAELQTMGGRFEAALADFAQALKIYASERAPTSGPRGGQIIATIRLGQLDARLGRGTRAAELYSEALAASGQYAQDLPDLPNGPRYRAIIHALRGEKSEARAAMAEATQLAARTHDAVTITEVRRSNAETLALLGETAAAIAELRAVHEQGYGFGYLLRLQLEWEPLRGDAKFQQLMKEAEARADAPPRPKK